MPPDVVSPPIVWIIEGLACDWRLLDERVEKVSTEIEVSTQRDAGVSVLYVEMLFEKRAMLFDLGDRTDVCLVCAP